MRDWIEMFGFVVLAPAAKSRMAGDCEGNRGSAASDDCTRTAAGKWIMSGSGYRPTSGQIFVDQFSVDVHGRLRAFSRRDHYVLRVLRGIAGDEYPRAGSFADHGRPAQLLSASACSRWTAVDLDRCKFPVLKNIAVRGRLVPSSKTMRSNLPSVPSRRLIFFS